MNRLEMFQALITRQPVKFRAKPFSGILGDINTERWYEGIVVGMEDLLCHDHDYMQDRYTMRVHHFKVLLYTPDREFVHVVVMSPQEGGL